MPDGHTDAQIRAALERIQGWPEMMRSPQLAGFLGYIVERVLAGEAQSIKAYTIAVDVFGRPPDFDAQSDPIVRVQARRLRNLLDDYYSGAGRDEPVRFALPVGRYVPEIRFADSAEAAPPPAGPVPRPRSALWWTGPFAFFAMILAGLGLVAIALILNAPSPAEIQAAAAADAVRPPAVTIHEFQNLTGDQSQQPVVAGLALELVTDLDLFGDVLARYGGAGHGDRASGAAPPADFDLTGIARLSNGVIQYSTILTDTATQSVVWSHVIEREAVETPPPGMVDDLSRELALLLGSPRGPIHAGLYDEIANGATLSGRESLYGCLMLFHYYRDTGSEDAASRAERCFAALPEMVRQRPMALAATARLMADATVAGGAAEDLAVATSLMDRAVHDGAISSFVWEHQASLHERAGRHEAARSAYGSALQLNPANADAMASLAMLLALNGDVAAARGLAETALTGTPEPVPDWYYGAAAITSLRAADFARAADYAEVFARSRDVLGPVLAVLAALDAGQSDMVNRYLPQVLDDAAFRAKGILPRLGERIGDRVLMADIRKGLIEAGVPSEALEGPY